MCSSDLPARRFAFSIHFGPVPVALWSYEFTPTEDGMYPFVTHAFNLVTHGAIGIFTAGDGDPSN